MKRVALVFQQTHDNPIAGVLITDQDVLNGFCYIRCRDCDGTGWFEMPDDTLVPCVVCKNTGREPVTL